MYDLIVIGGGAAGIFSALIAREKHPSASVLLVEKTAQLLAKVRISGGGRCNVTHHCFDPKILAINYPRGGKELIGPFHTFQPRDTIHFFEEKGVTLKAEKDGRMFPTTDQSQTIIDCLLSECKKNGVEISLRKKIERIEKGDTHFTLFLRDEEPLHCKKLLLATGSNPEGHTWAHSLGHTICPTRPSLFTFNIPDSPLKELSGIAVSDCIVSLKGTHLSQRGPLLITHFGLSGPAVIKLSAWGASYLFEKNYETEVVVNWVPNYSLETIFTLLLKAKEEAPQTTLASLNPFYLPKNLWKLLLGSIEEKKGVDISKKGLRQLGERLHHDTYLISGKTTHKEEFVTCGGVDLKEINFQKMESKLCKGLFFAGEILNIDGVTGGFNFQCAWTTGYIAGNKSLEQEI